MASRKKRFIYLIGGLVTVYLLLSFLIVPQLAWRTSFCGSCHATKEQYRSWTRSTHYRLSCTSCHGEPGIGGKFINGIRLIRNVFAWTTGTTKAAEAWANEDNCLGCHDNILFEKVRRRDTTMSHKEVVENRWRCSECHASVGHQTVQAPGSSGRPTMDKCFSCHRRGGVASDKCETCHTRSRILAKRTPTNPASLGSLAHTRDWLENHGTANIAACRQCHSRRYCVACHQTPMPHRSDWPQYHSREAKKIGVTPCYQCHRQQEFCDACHREPMPHQLPYRHRPNMAKTNLVCARCHYTEDCRICHVPHHRRPGEKQ